MSDVNFQTRIEIYQFFGKTEKSVNQDVEIVKNWIRTQPHLPEMMEDVKIINFLLLNKFGIEKTKEKIDMYYTIRSRIPEISENSNPKLPNIKEIFKTTYISIYPKLVNGINRAYFFKLKKPNTWNPLDYFKVFFNIYEIRLYEDCMVNDILICDLSTMSLGDMKKMTPTLVAKFVTMCKKVYSFRIKKIIYMNSPAYIAILVNILKSVLKPKIFDRLEVYPNSDILYQIFDKRCLPKDYGGEGPSLEELNGKMQEKFAKYQERFDKLDELKVDENLRPEKLENDDVLGFYGSFKKLEVD